VRFKSICFAGLCLNWVLLVRFLCLFPLSRWASDFFFVFPALTVWITRLRRISIVFAIMLFCRLFPPSLLLAAATCRREGRDRGGFRKKLLSVLVSCLIANLVVYKIHGGIIIYLVIMKCESKQSFSRSGEMLHSRHSITIIYNCPNWFGIGVFLQNISRVYARSF